MHRKISKKIAENSLKIGSIKLNPEKPFLWASGYYMPIYNDNRMNLGFPEHKDYIIRALIGFMCDINLHPQIIAGTSTAGIPWASSLQDRLERPMIYVRDKPKDHGLRNQIEGIDSENDLAGRDVVLIEDLVSTGGSSVKAVSAIRGARGNIAHCISIFNYGFDEALAMFRGEVAFDKSGSKLDAPCKLVSLLEYDTLIETAVRLGYVKPSQEETLREWRKDPFNWGEKNGFSPVKK